MISTRSSHPKFEVGQDVVCLVSARKRVVGEVIKFQQCRDDLGKRTIEYLIRPALDDGQPFWAYEKTILLSSVESEDETLAVDIDYSDELNPDFRSSYQEGQMESRLPLDVTLREEVPYSPNLCPERRASDGESVTTLSAYSPIPDPPLTPLLKSTGKKKQAKRDFVIKFPEILKRKLEEDERHIQELGMVTKVPAKPNVVVILESFLKNYVLNLVIKTPEKSKAGSKDLTLPERVSLCKEYVDNIRILFDFTLDSSLLYSEEEIQREKSKIIKLETPPCGEEGEEPETEVSSVVAEGKLDEDAAEDADSIPLSKLVKRSRTNSVFSDSDNLLRKNIGSPRSQTESQTSSDSFNKSLGAPQNPKLFVSSRPGDCKILDDVNKWSLVPPTVYRQAPPIPCLVYGGVHLLRLMALLPDILSQMALPDEKWSAVKSYTEILLQNRISSFADARNFAGQIQKSDSKKVLDWMAEKVAASLTASEYAEKVRQFMIDSYCWQSLVATATVSRTASFGGDGCSPFHPNSPPYSPTPATHPLPTPTQPNGIQQHVTFASEGRIFTVPPIWKRLLAEGIDFVFLLILKILVTIVVSDYVDFFEMPEGMDFEAVFEKMDYATAYSIASDLFALELLHKCIVCIYETAFLATGRRYGGATPGKAMMGLRVVRGQRIAPQGPGRVRVEPGADLGYGRALLRACIKNFGSTLFFPVGLPFFLVVHNRTIYDVFSGSIVVE